jgi:hypothetical protein
MIQGGLRDIDQRNQEENLMPHWQRQRHVEGSLWAAFMAGYRAANKEKPAP